jgi:hypothetical protein
LIGAQLLLGLNFVLRQVSPIFQIILMNELLIAILTDVTGVWILIKAQIDIV